MARRDFESILDDCLNALERGESLEACLARYPQHAQELRPLLTVARRMRRLPVTRPRSAAQTVAWQRFYQRSSDLRMTKARRTMPWLRPLAIAASVLLALILAGSGTIYAASRSLPDSPLYRVKLATEEARLWFVFDDKEEADILLDQSETRIDEIMKLVRDGNEVPGNVLSALGNRTSRAARILEQEPNDEALRARARDLAVRHEELLMGLWESVSPGARDNYAAAMATLHNTRLSIEGIAAVFRPEDLEFGVMQVSGVAQPSATDATVWLIGGLEVRVDDRAIRNQELEADRIVNVVVGRGTDNRLRALNLMVGEPEEPAEQEVIITGVVQAVEEDEVEIAGQRIAITENTLRMLRLNQGSKVEVAAKTVDGKVVATTVKSAPEAPATAAATLAFEGTAEEDLRQQNESTPWHVGGQTFLVTSATIIDAQAGDVREGARARIEAERVGSDLVAKRVVILADEDTEDDAVALEGLFQGVRDGRWQVSGVPVDPPSGQASPAAGTLVKIEGERKGMGVQASQALSIYKPNGDTLVSVQGLILSISKNEWLVGLTSVKIKANTRISGKAILGARAQVWGQITDGTLEAVYIDVLDDSPIIPTFKPPQEAEDHSSPDADDER